MTNTYQQCVRCVMSNDVDTSIVFNEQGVCHHCLRYDELLTTRVFSGEDAESRLAAVVSKIKKSRKASSQYDCLIGVSGGVDSTYVAYLVKQLGLRPLAVHFDNGWNSELAVKNIEKTLQKLDIDLVTYVVDWKEFKDLQLSFLKASVPDGEIPTDHAIFALLWKTAVKHNIKYIISGMNFATESISVPNWSYGHSDWKYIKDVHKKHGSIVLKSYPHYNLAQLFYYNFIRGIRSVSILNYVDYNKDRVMKLLQDELGWVYYGGKHYESIYTRFFQGYILPEKFNIDKRYGHYSDLINARQISREQALEELKTNSYSDELKEADLAYAAKKFSLTPEQFKEILATPPSSYHDYKNSASVIANLKKLVNFLRKIGLYPK
ncbi:N-acetyl sugar amidotransferase [Pseudomonas sp. GZD-222]|uniref:N-acetyl sugar amidotransferase n=1 Tax=Pseudomonas sp. GZD-222 TaxID=3404805 RepID=UPI003BB64FE1